MWVHQVPEGQCIPLTCKPNMYRDNGLNLRVAEPEEIITVKPKTEAAYTTARVHVGNEVRISRIPIDTSQMVPEFPYAIRIKGYASSPGEEDIIAVLRSTNPMVYEWIGNVVDVEVKS